MLRLRHEIARRSGWLRRRYPEGSWTQWHPPELDPILERVRSGKGNFVPLDEAPAIESYRSSFASSREDVLDRAERAVAGEQTYFSRLRHVWSGLPDWRCNPFTGAVVPERHWTRLGFHSPEYGDLKSILEPSRFSVVHLLVRAYYHSGDDRYAGRFWDLIEDWAGKNPPQAGPLWICGQESSFRILAWSFGLHGFARSPETTDERVRLLSAMIAAHADRVRGTLAYARSQKNNHALSEGAGLWTAGLLFPEYSDASRWRRSGRALLEEETRRQVYPDGSYVQHSVNYHRVMMHVLIWSLRLGEVHGTPLSADVYEALGRATDFLFQLTDANSGRAPNYGANDGALVLPWNACGYRDMRPTVQAASWIVGRRSRLESGPWDEDLFWLFGPEALEGEDEASGEARRSCRFEAGGYTTLRGRESWGMVRCARYRDRPGSADQLHLDLWWRGENVARDAGTFLYNAPPPWNNALVTTRVHNTVTVDGADQMRRVGTFQWVDWAQGRTRRLLRSEAGHVECWVGEHDGYRSRGVVHRRSVVRCGDRWIVIDDLVGDGEHELELHWLLPDLPRASDEVDGGTVTLETRGGAFRIDVAGGSSGTTSLIRAGRRIAPGEPDPSERPDRLRGWISDHYGEKRPALSLVHRVRSVLPARLVSVLGPGGGTRSMRPDGVEIAGSGTGVRMRFAAIGDDRALEWLELVGPEGAERVGLRDVPGPVTDTRSRGGRPR